MASAQKWFSSDEGGEAGDDPITEAVGELGEALRRGGFDRALIFNAAEAVAGTDAELQEVFDGLLLVWGMGLLLRPEAAPSLEPIRDLVHGIAAQLPQEEATEEGATPTPPDAPEGGAASYDSVLGELQALLERDGFSLYAYQQATAALKEVPIESDEDLASLYDAMLRMNDLSMRYAAGEDAEALAVLTPAIEKMKELAELDEIPALAPDEMRARAEALLREMRRNLEAGESPSVAGTRATTNLQLLGMQIGREDEESLRMLTNMSVQIFMALQPYIPAGTDNVFNEAAPLLNSMTAALDIDQDDAVGAAVFQRQFEEQGDRLQQTAVAQGETQKNPNEVADIAHVRQFAALLPDLWDRVKLVPQPQEVEGEVEQAEAERLGQRLDRALRTIQHAYSEEQLIRHQRETLRGAVLELRQFERRRHLMLLRPAFPTDALTVPVRR